MHVGHRGRERGRAAAEGGLDGDDSIDEKGTVTVIAVGTGGAVTTCAGAGVGAAAADGVAIATTPRSLASLK